MRVANAQIKHLVKPARAEERLVQQIRAIRSANDEYSAAALFAIAHAI